MKIFEGIRQKTTQTVKKEKKTEKSVGHNRNLRSTLNDFFKVTHIIDWFKVPELFGPR